MHRGHKNFVVAKVIGTNIRAEALTYTYMSQGLGAFFGDLAHHWQGWPGRKEWFSLEEELKLSATCDRLGHIFLLVNLKTGTPPVWNLQIELILEAGQLEDLAAQACAFEAIAFF